MYLQKMKIEHFRSIEHLEWELDESELAGWHVILGDNGSGKSTFLRAIALGLLDGSDIYSLQQNLNGWIAHGKTSTSIELSLNNQELGRLNYQKIKTKIYSDNKYTAIGKNPEHRVTGFSVGFGPFRRFSGTDRTMESLVKSHRDFVAHLSLFNENIGLSGMLELLQNLRFKQLEDKREGEFLDKIKSFINSKGFLPNNAQMTEISSEGVFFTDGNGNSLSVEDLSDGYRSILSMVLEIIRLLSLTFSHEKIFNEDTTKIVAPGIVLIDEVDAHLHPTWQKQIGVWFRDHFPNMQFIVTTHSPLVCQAAEQGSVWRLPAPGSNEVFRRIEGVDLQRLLYGNILEAYGTEIFGENVTRSESAQMKLERLARLNRKEIQEGLTEAEESEQIELRAIFPTSSGIESA
ncbi:MAG: AAA family ATPase [Anaerolineae bacterium]|jgi:predicted ATP-binding protein involved in virulence|nr:AAA family ATPase [Anaerolineae bacterium]